MFVTAIFFCYGYVVNQILFDPILALSRTTFICYEFEPKLFEENQPEFYESFGDAVRNLPDDRKIQPDSELTWSQQEIIGDENA